jgi:hypothetical protein
VEIGRVARSFVRERDVAGVEVSPPHDAKMPMLTRVFLRGRSRPATALIVAFIDSHVGERQADADGPGLGCRIELICSQLTQLGCKITPATAYEHRSRAPSKR